MRNRIDTKILNKIADGTASESELQVFNDLLSTLDAVQYENVLNDFEKLIEGRADQPVKDSGLWEKIRQDVEAHEEYKKARNRKIVAWFSVAASLILVAAAALFMRNKSVSEMQNLSFEDRLSNDVLPGKNQAVLELSDGSTIVLDESASSKILDVSGIVVKRTEDGQLVYDFEGKSQSNSTEPVYHAISTPNGGQYQVVLPDGTRVWLNASSRLRFPTVFEGKQRRIEFSGEAYFEVASDHKKPFIVHTEKETVKVLGTEFNLNAYPDDMSSRTTLLNGKVEVFPKEMNSRARILRPGQQSIIRGEDIQIVKVDTTEAVAWKNGEFMFNRESIESVMRKIARWYDVEVIYNKPISDEVKIWGSVSRFDNISEILKFIERTKVVHFKVEGRKVYVLK